MLAFKKFTINFLIIIQLILVDIHPEFQSMEDQIKGLFTQDLGIPLDLIHFQYQEACKEQTRGYLAHFCLSPNKESQWKIIYWNKSTFLKAFKVFWEKS